MTFKSANLARILQYWKAIRKVRQSKMPTSIANHYTMGLFDKLFKPVERSFFKHPEIKALGIGWKTPIKNIDARLKQLQFRPTPTSTSPAPPATPPVQPGKEVQGVFDFLNKL